MGQARADDLVAGGGEHRGQVVRRDGPGQVGPHPGEPGGPAVVQAVGQPGPTDAQVVGQHARGLTELGDDQQAPGGQQPPEQPQRGDLVTDVVQRHRRPDHVGRCEPVEPVRQLGEVGADPAGQPVIGRPSGRPLEHRRRAVDGDHVGLGEPTGQLARADTRTAPDVDDPPHRRRVRTALLGDPRRGVRHEALQHLALQLGDGGPRPPVRLVDGTVPVPVPVVLVVVVVVRLVVRGHAGHARNGGGIRIQSC